MVKARVPGPVTPRLEEQLCFAVYLAGHAFNRMYRTVLSDLGLTYPQYLVMLVLWECDGLSVKAVGERLMLDSGTLTPLLKRLEAVGLIRRERSRQDERQVRLLLTQAGEAMREKGRCVPEAMGSAIAQSPADIGRLAAQLKALREALLNAAADKG
jgi:DNA-binding MarR family transcriptional regulator